MESSNSRFAWSEPSPNAQTVTLTLDGQQVAVPAGISVAAALLSRDDAHFCRSPGTGERRSPYCLMGICFECQVTIDGVHDRQACLEPVRDGMRVDRQRAAQDEDHEG